MQLRFALAAFLLAVTAIAWLEPAFGQTADGSGAPSLDSFAVASIRRNLNPTYMRFDYPANGFVAEGVTLRELIQSAYNVVGYDRLEGKPEWLDTDHFNVNAKIDDAFAGQFADISLDQRRLMIRRLLADRFGLVVHYKKVVRPIYELAISKDGPKLNTTAASDMFHSPIKGINGFVRHNGKGFCEVEGFSMDALASYLESQRIVDRPVVNVTGLSGYYSFSLHWFPGNESPRPGREVDRPPDAPLDPPGASTIFSEIQKQLGLKLQPTKGPVEILVVDHVGQPTEN